MNEENPRIVIEFSGNDAQLQATNVTPFQLLGAAALLREEARLHYSMSRVAQLQREAQMQNAGGLAIARTMPKVD